MKDFSDCIKKLKEMKAKKVLLQFPEGLRYKVRKIVKELEEEGFDVVICLERCYGACDVRDHEAKIMNCDVILHIGHEEFVKKTEAPVVYWEYRIESDPIPILEKEVGKIKEKKIGLITSIQFVDLIPVVKRFLEKKGKEVYVGKTLKYPGQVLGCDVSAAKVVEKNVECFLAISAGEFYAKGIVVKTEKPVYNLDLERGEIVSLLEFRKKIKKIIEWNRACFKDAKNVGLIVSWKKGQYKEPFEVKRMLEKMGKKVFVLAMDEVSPEKVKFLGLDFLVNLACPRIGIDDISRYDLPLLNFEDIKLG